MWKVSLVKCGNYCPFNGIFANTNVLRGCTCGLEVFFMFSPFFPKSLLNKTANLVDVLLLHVSISARNCFCVQRRANLNLECLHVFHKYSFFILKMTHVDATIL